MAAWNKQEPEAFPMKDKAKSAAKAPATGPRAPKRAAKPEKSAEKAGAAEKKAKPAGVKTAKAAPKTRSAKTPAPAKGEKKAVQSAEKDSPRAKEPKTPKPRTSTAKTRKSKTQPEASEHRIGEPIVDPLGDTTDGEGRVYLGDGSADAVHGEPEQADSEIAAFRKETHIEASDAPLEAGPGMEAAAEALETRARDTARNAAGNARTQASDVEDEVADTEAHGPARLERLQKILSQAGVASRRRAEEMITGGRVMVNGQVVTALGSKADPARDHIRVDGKLLHGAERHRYFVLNKPRGYVTTVSDPEGRPTVMDLLPKSHGRLYPVGRLDYQSEGLLLMTNDGELANLLTKAASGVEKTYLVKVAGRPSAQDLERLRSGVAIEKGEQGSERVTTAPARVRPVREGENPWFEVVLIEGRNRELRKMFSAVGHFVEKIRRVGYGPLQLDVEPGEMRELSPEEVNVLRLAAEGKLKPKRLHADRMLPKDAGRPAEQRHDKRDKRGARRGGEFGRRDRGGFERRESGGFAGHEKKPFRPRVENRGFGGPQNEGKRDGTERGGFRGRREGQSFGGARPRFDKPKFGRPAFGGGPRREQRHEGSARDGKGFDGERKPFRERQGFDGARKPVGEGRGRDRGERKPFRERGDQNFGRGERKPFRPHGERPYFKRSDRPQQRRDEAAGGFAERRGRDWSDHPAQRNPIRRDNDKPLGETRAPRPPAPEFRGPNKNFGRKFGGKKPAFGGRQGGFGGPRRDGGRGGPRPGGGKFGGRKRG
jgi:23S rRNA pseudouridine2605 synthase